MLKIEFVDVLTTQSLFKEALGSLYNQQYYQENKEHFGNYIIIFQATKQKDKKWSIIRKTQEIVDFIKKMKKKLQLNHNEFNQIFEKQDNKSINEYGLLYASCINKICNHDQALKHTEVLNFFQQSKDSAYKEFRMYKLSGGRYRENSCCKIGAIFRCWKIRTVSIYNKGISYCNSKNQIKEYISFDNCFSYYFGMAETQSKLGIIIIGNHRRLRLQALCIYDFILFLYLFRVIIRQCPYMNLNRFNSFCPARYFSSINYYIDGEEYFQQIASSILKAEISIFMTGWMISPEFHLIRGSNSLTLKSALKTAASKGVHVSIIVYRQSSFLPNDSEYTKEQLQALHQNIKVLRHPNYSLPTFWSHHQKIVIIDQKIGFSGGFDLCYGRYDNKSHPLFEQQPSLKLYPGIEYNNLRIQDINDVRNYMLDHMDRKEPRLPWHDIGQSVKGEIVNDMAHHFIQYWNFASYENNRVKTDIKSQKVDQKQMVFNHRNQYQQKQQNILISMVKLGIQSMKKKGSQGIDKIKQIASIYKKPSEIIRQHNECEVANIQQYLQTVKQEVQHIKQQGQKQPTRSSKIMKPILSIQKSKKDNSIEDGYISVLQKIKQNYLQGENDQSNNQQQQQDDIGSDNQSEVKMDVNESILKIGEDQCQMLRSVSNWSIGLHHKHAQFSIHIAYIELIAHARNYIYLENQFFISSLADKSVKNQIADAIFMRISHAIKLKQSFKVYVMIPLLPGFAGDLQKQQCNILRTIMSWQYKTIYSSENSLLKKLYSITTNPQDYIQFFSLRTHGQYDHHTQPKTQIIYIHSKLMIIDDEYVVCGSANINDRSMLGNRDSQIAVVSKGSNDSIGVMNGQRCAVWSTAQNLRIQLWKQHFKLTNVEAIDPTSTNTWNNIYITAKNNTAIYRRVFGCYPDNQIEYRKDIIPFRQKSRIQEYSGLKDDIKGNVVLFPYKFLNKDPVEASMANVQYYMPTELLT